MREKAGVHAPAPFTEADMNATMATADFAAWTEQITALDAALTDAATARATIDAECLTLERLEASAVLRIEGGNAETRKARLTLALADDARHEAHRQRLTAARHCLMDAERRVQVSRERCRLLRVSLGLLCGQGDTRPE